VVAELTVARSGGGGGGWEAWWQGLQCFFFFRVKTPAPVFSYSFFYVLTLGSLLYIPVLLLSSLSIPLFFFTYVLLLSLSVLFFLFRSL
jgi:hypothetical protein